MCIRDRRYRYAIPHNCVWCKPVTNNGYGICKLLLGSNIHLLYMVRRMAAIYIPMIKVKILTVSLSIFIVFSYFILTKVLRQASSNFVLISRLPTVAMIHTDLPELPLNKSIDFEVLCYFILYMW